MNNKQCELCDSEAEMDFNCVMPSFDNKTVEGDLCLECYADVENDIELAVKIVDNRAKTKGMIKSMITSEVLVTLFKRS